MKILLIDDHDLIREALQGILQGILKELRCNATVLEATNGSQGLSLAGGHADLELVLLDLSLPDCDGFNVLAELRGLYPSVSIVVLSAASDRDTVMRALDIGAVGFIPKSTQRAVMLRALQLVLSGGIYIPPEILSREEILPEILSREEPPPSTRPRQFATEWARIHPRGLGLTERQVEVLALMMQGKSNKAISRVLHLSESTVKNHAVAIFKALRVTNRTEAAMAVVEHGWELRPTANEG